MVRFIAVKALALSATTARTTVQCDARPALGVN